jgi:hypothetical protein
MEKISKKLEKLFAATAFAEEGDAETARQLIQEEENDRSRTSSSSKKGVPISISPCESRG